MARHLHNLSAEQQKHVLLRLIKALMKEAKDMGLVGVPALLFVMRNDHPVPWMLSTMPHDDIEAAMELIRGMIIKDVHDVTEETEGS